jgi:hypothetical protein
MARGKNVYLKTESGKVQDFDQFRKTLSKLSTPENMRFKQLRQLLKREAKPLVQAARTAAYNDLQTKSRLKVRGGQNAKKGDKGAFYNLYKSIDVFPNKDNISKVYVVVGLRGKRKKGAYYAKWQLFGGTEKNFKAKEFMDKALENSDVPAKAQKLISNFVRKRIKEQLR